jgi:hypothetical protein
MSFEGSFENVEIHRFDERIGLGVTEEEELEALKLKPTKPDKKGLDSPDTQKTLRRLLHWWYRERQLQAENRTAQMDDHKFYDGDQWTPDDEQYLKDRGQKALVFNQIKPTIDWVLGTEKRTRIDYKILPRRKQNGLNAEIKTKGMKFISDVNKEAFQRSKAFEDSTKGGVGWLEYGVRSDPTDERIFVRYEDWRNVWYDSLATEIGMDDARYLFRAKWIDLDVGCAMFPDRASLIKAASINDYTYYDEEMSGIDIEPVEGESGFLLDQWHGLQTPYFRSRVRLVEGWYRLPMRVKIMRGQELGSLSGVRFDQQDDDHNYLVESGIASLHDAIKMQMRVMMFCSTGALQDMDSPYNHNKFPLVPIWSHRRKKDNTPYGMITQIKDPQEDLNKRRSKALFILSTNQTVADDNATDDWDDFKAELDRPDGLIRKKQGTDVIINKDTQLAEEHIMLMHQDADYIERTSGVNDEMMGRQTNAVSGKAIAQRYEMGTVVTATQYDNLRLAFQLGGEIKLSLMEQFWTEEKEFRITGQKGQPEFINVNTPDPQTGEMTNDITASQADFVVDEQAHSATVRAAMFEQMMELAEKLVGIAPEVVLAILDLIVDLSDIPTKDAYIERIRKITGQKDPFRDPDDPEVQAEEKAEQEAEARAQAIKQLLEDLAVEKEKQTARKLAADADDKEKKLAPEIEKIEAETEAIDEKLKLEAQKIEDASEEAETKSEIERAKTLHLIESSEKDRSSTDRNAMLTRRDAKDQASAKPKKGAK